MAACRETGASIVFGLAERAKDGIYNSAVMLTPDGRSVCYRKAHLFDTETLVFDRAGESPRLGRAKAARVGLMVCFDWRFPEAARTLALEGADVIAHPANLVHPHCQDAMITAARKPRVTVTAKWTGSKPSAAPSRSREDQIVSPWGSDSSMPAPPSA
jgi:predicted amidohydrolase